MFSVYPIPSWWLREYIALSYHHHQIGSMNYYPLFRVRSWNNDMRCMSLYILTTSYTVITIFDDVLGVVFLNNATEIIIPSIVQIRAIHKHVSKFAMYNQISLYSLLSYRYYLAVRVITNSSSTFSATNINSNITWLLQLHDTIQMKSNYRWIHIMIYDSV